MTRHSGQKRVKRFNTPKFFQIKRKHGKFTVKPSPGPHQSRFSLPLAHILRDILDFCDSFREVKKLLQLGVAKVDGRVVRDEAFPLGLMDVLSLKDKLYYRILPHSHYGLILEEIDEEASQFKLCRINEKTTVKGGHIQLNLHDGRNILIEVKDPEEPKEDVYKRMDVLKISVPEQEILQTIKLKTGAVGLIIDGLNIGNVGKIVEISKRFGPNASTVTIEDKEGDLIQTSYDYIFPLGTETPEIEIEIE
ncbi:MAG: 30S ribosomal protein S4e [Promethearchaeia archaeon]